MRLALSSPMISLHSLVRLGRRLACALVLGGLLWGAFLPVAAAQQTRTLDIRNGTVYVDGRPLTEDRLPDGLNVQGLSAQYRFLGIQRPVVELNGRLYAVEENRLRPVTEEEVQDERASVILRGDRAQSSPLRAASDSPETDYRQYLTDVQRSSRELYERLVRERRMERDARDLARTIRLLPDGRERRAQIDTLHTLLEHIFELKQDNRRREIKHLQRQIRELQESIQKREQMRDLMIDRRLRQLIESSGERQR